MEERNGLFIGDKVTHWFAGVGVIIAFIGNSAARCQWINGFGIAYIKDLRLLK